jgi:general secretion pathway protein L
MSETLVIRLRAAEEAPASWLVVDGNGARSGPLLSGPASDALNLSAGRRVILLVPGTEVTLAEPELPVKSGARLAQVVPYALEEQLASDVDTLHFAVGTRSPGAVGTPVAIISRTLMQRWHDELEAAGIHADAAYADSTVVPVAAMGCTLLLDGTLLYVRRADGLPFVLDAAVLSEALDVAVPAAQTGDSGADSAENVTFYASAENYEANREMIEGLRSRTASLVVKLLPEGPLPVLAAQAVSSPGINLLQGPFSARASLGMRLRPWRLPAALAAGVALLFLVNQGLSYWQDHRREKALDAQIAQVFSEVLPGQPIVDPRAQIQGVLGGRSAAGGGLLPAMSALAEAMAQTPSAKIESMSYRGDALELRVTAPTVESLDGIKQAISRNGISAELQSATPRGGVVEGRLQVKLGRA